MTQEEIIKMAEQAGIKDSLEYDHMECNVQSLKAFAKLIVERESCALIGDGYHDEDANCGDLIRARGQQ